jgi:DNA-binding transcriptional LysR family regulator
VLAERGPAVLKGFDALWEQVRRAGAGDTGTVTLLHAISLSNQTVPLLLKAWSELLPDVRVVAEVAGTPAIGPAVARGEAEVGLTRCAQGAAGTRDVLVRRQTCGALVATGHPLAGRRTVTLHDIASYPVVLRSRDANPAHHDAIVAMFADAGLAPEFVQPPMAYDVSQSMIRSTDAVGVVSESAAAVTPPGTTLLPIGDPGVVIPIYLVLPAGSLTPLQERLEQAALRSAAAQGWLDADGLEP